MAGRGHLESLTRSDMLVRCKPRHMGCLPLWILHVSVVFSLCSVTDQESYGQAQSFQFLVDHTACKRVPRDDLDLAGSVRNAVRTEVATLDVYTPHAETRASAQQRAKSHVMRRKSSRSFRAGMDPRPPAAGARGFYRPTPANYRPSRDELCMLGGR